MTFTDYVFNKSKDLKKIAVINKEETSYSEIYRSIKHIVYILQQSNYSKKDSVLIVSENSLFFIKTYFGVIKNGNVCVPINPAISEKDLVYIIKVLNIKLIFCQEKYRSKIEKLIDENILLYSENDTSGDQLQPILEPSVNIKEDTALIMFTSGSTSKPKGVMLTHYNLMYNTNSIIKYLNLTEKDRIEVVLPFYYCYGTSLLNTHFKCGGSLVINNRFMFPQTVIEHINKYNCTGFAGVPSTYQILLRMTNLKNCKLPSLRYLTQAGGSLPETVISELCSVLENVHIYIMYGQTEATARLSYLPPNRIKDKLGSIGKGIPGTELMILDKKGVPVKAGEVGEIVAKGGNIMKGYFNDQDETKKVLRNGLLYTGDLALKDEEGYIFIVSREKNIIKCAGNRISPKEVENIIASIQQVVECAVIGVEDDILGEAIKAFVVLRKDCNVIDEKYIIHYCNDRLPKFKVPKQVEFLKMLPKNSSGKVIFKDLKCM
ncbi:AMP-binding protein [Clostridium sp.]|jgi:acyl-CoA synthetase (AMP-forming)/AMP-acid ligase II|uniref:AMP-binding protein n=1 Tax=Clostridium sp. TaxID=1506 RepID=UPI002586D982|nr:AMP-binding protein [Clostridium sp.]MDF2502913.1 acyl-CoA synthetase (AMP-forming)/AMP-acid ligase [Clostridium sp.]